MPANYATPKGYRAGAAGPIDSGGAGGTRAGPGRERFGTAVCAANCATRESTRAGAGRPERAPGGTWVRLGRAELREIRPARVARTRRLGDAWGKLVVCIVVYQ